MTEGKFVSYLRVSTQKQGRSGLGLEAQRATVEQFLNGDQWELLSEYVEVETGKRNDRPQLAKALRHARATGATLVVAKLDRLSRNAAFLLALRDSGVAFVCADMPQANNLTIGILALVAQEERESISRRTREALAARRARGLGLGDHTEKGAGRGARHLYRLNVERGNELAIGAVRLKAQERAEGLRWAFEELAERSHQAAARELNGRGILSPRGGRWTATSVSRVRHRLAMPGS